MLKHSENKLHQCIFCGKSFKDIDSMKKHVRIHDAIREEFICKYCHSIYHRKDHLIRHLKKKHPNIVVQSYKKFCNVFKFQNLSCSLLFESV